MQSGLWIVDMSEYISQNPTFFVNKFIKSGITGAFDSLAESTKKHEDQVSKDDDESEDNTNSVIEL